MKAIFLGIFFSLCACEVGVAGETTTFFHNDAAGSALMATDINGGIVWRETYRPYGDRVIKSPKSSNNAIWFTGKPQDEQTGLSYYGARYYDPILGRFMSVDPAQISLENLHSFNRYAYANNNPYRYVDPDGRDPAPLFTGFQQNGYLAFAQYQRDVYKQTGEVVSHYPYPRDENMPKFAMIWAGFVAAPLIGSAEVWGGVGAVVADSLAVPNAVVTGEVALAEAGGSAATARIGIAAVDKIKGAVSSIYQSIRVLTGRTGIALTMEGVADATGFAATATDVAGAVEVAEIAEAGAGVQEISKIAEAARKLAEAGRCIVTTSCPL